MHIKEVSHNDINTIKEIATVAIHTSVHASDSVINQVISDTENHIDKNISGKDCIFLKYTDKEILGFILIQDYWNLSDLFVLPRAHRLGIGKALFTEAKAICISNTNKGYIRVNSSTNAESFYRSMGFETFIQNKDVPNYVVPLIYSF